ncbi:hypothetical protein [Metabacillus sediminilitoris]|uniref:hypothetical protein n=1 Tax=Metabacillus sediminilitoris TaxID=2567941 RepID=UPI0012D7F31C|nr:hypothetical protein [Metabacillus sediminilitoris]QGQ46375.1 hypothetical protein GMB29_14810 [Metabacillus sediminilitoris]
MKQYIFTVDDRELIINASGISDAVEQIKLIMKFDGTKYSTQMKSIEFKGVKY